MVEARPIETMPATANGRARQNALDPVALDDDLDFHALLYPNRSLTKGGFRQIMALIIGANIINALIYFALGAWPVVFFCLLDIGIVWLAFTISYQQGRHHERVMLTDDALWISRVLPSGHETRWKLNPAFVRLDIKRPITHESQICLRQHGRTLIVGKFLSPKERGEFAEALSAALAPRQL